MWLDRRTLDALTGAAELTLFAIRGASTDALDAPTRHAIQPGGARRLIAAALRSIAVAIIACAVVLAVVID